MTGQSDCLLPLLTLTLVTDASLASIPYDLLLAELAKRDDVDTKPQCGGGKKGAYDTPLHVFALFLILALSTLGTHRWTSTNPWIPQTMR